MSAGGPRDRGRTLPHDLPDHNCNHPDCADPLCAGFSHHDKRGRAFAVDARIVGYGRPTS